MFDKKSVLLEKNQQVSVLKPMGCDTHKASFVGVIIDILESRGTAMVENSCGEVYEVSADRLIVK